MFNPDLSKIRTFSLAVSMILLVYAFAGIGIDSTKELKFLDIPITLLVPKLIPWALILTTLYGAFQYWFYGVRRYSTWQIRGEIRKRFTEKDGRLELILATRDDVIWWNDRIEHAYAGVEDAASEEKEDNSWILWIVPPKSRLPSLLRDIDYAAPVWVAALALIVGLWRLSFF